MSKYNFIIYIFLCFVYFSDPALSSNVVPNDDDYSTYEDIDSNFLYIFPKDDLEKTKWLSKKSVLFKNLYEKEFFWKLDEKTAFILTSLKNQDSNAFATNYPNLTALYYRGGVDVFDRFAIQSWPLALVSHEMAHLYQINPKKGLAKFGYKIFGNKPIGFLPIPLWTNPITTLPIPYFTNPNQVMPTWILEGNAVYNECRFGNGGRLYSGYYRALFFSQLKENILNVERLTNNVNEFPFKTEKYITGGYLFLYLANKYKKDGDSQVNSIFNWHADNYFNPLDLSDTFKAKFGRSYTEVVNDALRYYSKTASKMKYLDGKLITKSLTHYPLNSDENEIFFLTNESGYTKLRLNSFSKKNKQLNSRYFHVHGGKLFKFNNKYYSSSSGRDLNDADIFSLYSEDDGRLDEFDNKIVFDKKKNVILSSDLSKSFHAPFLELSGSKFNSASHSSAILDSKNRAIYFKQHKKIRGLYRGEKLLFRFKGHYGYPVDTEKNKIYFIAATKLGSSLYVYDNGQVHRLFNADTIIDARLIKDNEFLLTEITAKGYYYKVSKIKKIVKNTRPFEYKYFFEKSQKIKIADSVVHRSSATSKIKNVETDSYNFISQLRFSNWSFSYLGSDTSKETDISATFSDPLLYNNFLFNYENEQNMKYSRLNLLYTNSKYLLSSSFLIDYEKYGIANDHSLSSTLFVSYPFLNHRNWDFSVKLGLGVEDDYNLNYVNKYQYLSLRLRYLLKFSRALENNQSFIFNIEAKNEEYKKTYSLFLANTTRLGNEFYFNVDSVLNYTDIGTLAIGEPLYFDKPLVPFTGLNAFSFDEITSLRVGTSFKKIFDSPLYSSWFPLGLRRFAPSLIGNYFNIPKANTSFFEGGLGYKFEIILAHTLVLDFEFYYLKTKSISNSANSSSLSFAFNGDF